MASAWGNSWSSYWGNSWGVITTATVVGSISRGGGRRYVELKERSVWDRTLTRKNWREIQALLAAEEAASKVPEAAEAVETVAEVIEQLEQPTVAIVNSELERLTGLLKGAVRASSMKETLDWAARAKAYAEAVMRRIEDEDEEIAVITMLLH